MLNYQLEMVRSESVTSIDYYDEYNFMWICFSAALLIDRCIHIWVIESESRDFLHGSRFKLVIDSSHFRILIEALDFVKSAEGRK